MAEASVGLALARADSQAGTLEARVEARALRIEGHLVTRSRRREHPLAGELLAVTQSALGGMVQRHSLASTAVGARGTLVVPPSSGRPSSTGVDPVGGRLQRWSGIQVAGKAPASVVAQHVRRDRRHLLPVPVDDGKAQARLLQDHRERHGVDPCCSGLEAADRGPGESDGLRKLPLAEVSHPPGSDDEAGPVERLVLRPAATMLLAAAPAVRPTHRRHLPVSVDGATTLGQSPVPRKLLPKTEQDPIRQHPHQSPRRSETAPRTEQDPIRKLPHKPPRRSDPAPQTGAGSERRRVFATGWRPPGAQSALMMSSTRSLASPKSMTEFSRKKRGFWTPA